jgi:hypothetical protein
LFTLLEFHRSVDLNDPWGRHIKDNVGLLRDVTTNGTLSYSKLNVLEFPDMKTAEETYPRGYTQKGSSVYDHTVYAKCCITGKMVRRENATRLPLFVSPAGLRMMSGAIQDTDAGGHATLMWWSRIKDYIVKFDKDKLLRDGDKEWDKYHHKRMTYYHEEAVWFVQRHERRMLAQLQIDTY